MPTLRFDFSCSLSSSTGLIYVAGESDNQNELLATETYNVEENTWEILSPMIQPIGECDGVFLEDKFIVFNRYNSESFDPKTGVC